MSVTATAVIASALALPGASDATELTNKTSETPWTVSLKHDLKVKEIDAKEVVKKRALDSEVAEDRASEKSESVGKDGSHEVVSGDTLSEIAHKYGVTTEDLMAWNNLNNTLILPGQELALNGDAGEDSDSEGVAEELVIVEVDEEAEREAVEGEVAEAEVAEEETEREAREAEVAAEAERVAEEERAAAEQAAAEEEAAAVAEAEAAEEAEREEAERAAEEEAEREAEEARVAEEAAAAEENAAAEEAERAEAEAEEEEAKVEDAPEVQQASASTDNEATVETVSAEADNTDEQAEREAAEAEATEKKAEEERVAAEKKKEEERIAAQKQKEEEERKAAEAAKKAEQDRIAAEKKEADRKAAEAAEQKKKEEEAKAAEAEQSQVGGGDLISNAKSVIGTPYVWGGSQPGGFDCSGFIHWAHKESGNDIGRTSVEGYYNKSYIVSNPQPGDLVVFEGTYKSSMSHMGIYIGGGQMIHAGSSSGVAIANVKGPYWGDHFHSYKRFY